VLLVLHRVVCFGWMVFVEWWGLFVVEAVSFQGGGAGFCRWVMCWNGVKIRAVGIGGWCCVSVS